VEGVQLVGADDCSPTSAGHVGTLDAESALRWTCQSLHGPICALRRLVHLREAVHAITEQAAKADDLVDEGGRGRGGQPRVCALCRWGVDNTRCRRAREGA
jgi:hypothetical protein